MKKGIVVLLMIAIAAGGAFAQSIQDLPTARGGAIANYPQSPQSQATIGRFRSDADNINRPDSLNGVGFEKFYSMVSYNDTTTTPWLGFAGKLGKEGKVKIGVNYVGRFWNNFPAADYTEQRVTWITSASEKTVPVYDALPALAAAPYNRFYVTIAGIADMGFRVGLAANYRMFSADNFQVSGPPVAQYAGYTREFGTIAPHFAWAMAKNLTAKGIKPWAVIDLVIGRDYTSTEAALPSGATKPGPQITKNDMFIPQFVVGLGGLELLSTEGGFKLTFDVENNLRITTYDSEVSYMPSGGTKYKTRQISGTIAGSVYTEQSEVRNVLNPTLNGQWSGEKLALKYQFGLPITITSRPSTVMGLDGDKLKKNGADTSVSIFGIQPDLRLAAQWKFHSKASLNVGGRIQSGSLTTTTTESVQFATGTKVPNSNTTRKQTAFGTTFATTFNLGVTFNPIENLSVEANSGVNNNGSINTFGTTSGDGLFYFTSILVGIKF